jgi:anti-anti-sigma regulatory factor
VRFVGDNFCLKLVIDLRETTCLPSGVLGVLVQLHTGVSEVYLAYASGDVAEIMSVTQLNRMIHVNEVEVEL